MSQQTAAEMYRGRPFYNNSFALVVGINHYKHPKIPDLKFAENDANAVAHCLPGLGFPQENIKLLLGSQTKVTRDVIQNILEIEFKPQMEVDDRFLFYFAGHGVGYEVNRQKRGYILMQDSQLLGRWPSRTEPYLNKMPIKSLEMGQFLDFVKSLPVKHKLLLIDSCFSGFMTYTRGLPDGPQADITKKVFQWIREPVTQIITAGRSGQSAHEKGIYQHGLFTWYLLKGLEGNADTRGDGVISFLDLASFIRNRVANEKNTKQDPQVGTYEGEGQFFFLYGAETPKSSALRLPDNDKKLGDALANILNAHPSSFGTQGYVRRYEKGSIYFISKIEPPGPGRGELKENTFFRVYDSAIGIRYESMGGTRSPLGFPVGETKEVWNVKNGESKSMGSVQSFEGGNIYFCRRCGAHSLLSGEIGNVFGESEKELENNRGKKMTRNALGFPISEKIKVHSRTALGYVQRFEFGLIIQWDLGVYKILDGFYDVYKSLGEWNSDLEFPRSNDELFTSSISTLNGNIQYFQYGCLTWNRESNEWKFIVGKIFSEWKDNIDKYGFPLSNPYQVESGLEQLFEGGLINTEEDLFTTTSIQDDHTNCS